MARGAPFAEAPIPGSRGLMKNLRAGAVAVAILAVAQPLRAWNANTHKGITTAVVGAAAASDPLFRETFPETAPAETLECLLASGVLDRKGDGRTSSAFAANLKLNSAVAPINVPKAYSKFADFALGEIPAGGCKALGSSVKVSDMLEEYVLEPDWGMDREVCNNGGHGLYSCDASYKSMGAFDGGLASQAFRHMYWPGGYDEMSPAGIAKGVGLVLAYPALIVADIVDPNLGDKFTLKKVGAAIGQAPDRSQEFFDRALLAANGGHPYWAVRFLAWSMHYAQDVTQPFHAAQIPSDDLKGYTGSMEVKGQPVGGLVISHDKTAKNLAYYHMSFESYIDKYLSAGDVAKGSADWQTQGEAKWVTSNAARFGAAHAEQAGEASVDFFQPPPAEVQAVDIQGFLSGKGGYIAKSGNPPSEFSSLAQQCMAEAGSATKNMLWLFETKVQAASAAAPASASTPVGPAYDPKKMGQVNARVRAILSSGDGAPFQP